MALELMENPEKLLRMVDNKHMVNINQTGKLNKFIYQKCQIFMTYLIVMYVNEILEISFSMIAK